MPRADAHIVADTVDDEETGGGWAMEAAFCPDHCPGNCDHPKEHS